MVKDEVEIDSVLPQAPVGRPKVETIQALPRIGQDQSPGVNGLQVASGHLQDQGHVRRDHGDDTRASLNPTKHFVTTFEGIFTKCLKS